MLTTSSSSVSTSAGGSKYSTRAEAGCSMTAFRSARLIGGTTKRASFQPGPSGERSNCGSKSVRSVSTSVNCSGCASISRASSASAASRSDAVRVIVTSSSHWSTTSNRRRPMFCWHQASMAASMRSGATAGPPGASGGHGLRQRVERGGPRAHHRQDLPARVRLEPREHARLDQARLARARRAEHDHEGRAVRSPPAARWWRPRARRTAGRRRGRRRPGHATGFASKSSGGAGGSDSSRPGTVKTNSPLSWRAIGQSRGVWRFPASMVATCRRSSM